MLFRSNISSVEGQPKLILRAVTISKQAAGQLQGLLSAGELVQVTPWVPIYSRFDSSEIVMWLIAVGAVTGAALWAGHDFQEERLLSQASHSQVQELLRYRSCIVSMHGQQSRLPTVSSAMGALHPTYPLQSFVSMHHIESAAIYSVVFALGVLCSWEDIWAWHLIAMWRLLT